MEFKMPFINDGEWSDPNSFLAALTAGLATATAGLIPGAAFNVIPGAGHLPCVEAPDAWAGLVGPFLKAHAHG